MDDEERDKESQTKDAKMPPIEGYNRYYYLDWKLSNTFLLNNRYYLD